MLRGICDCASRGGGGRGGTVFLVRFIRDWLPKFSPLSLCLLVLFLSLVLVLLALVFVGVWRIVLLLLDFFGEFWTVLWGFISVDNELSKGGEICCKTLLPASGDAWLLCFCVEAENERSGEEEEQQERRWLLLPLLMLPDVVPKTAF